MLRFWWSGFPIKKLWLMWGIPSDDEGNGSFVDIIDAPRSSGSILKPLLYTFMLDEGEILPDKLVPDIPTHISGYSPLNFDRTYSGAVPASTCSGQVTECSGRTHVAHLRTGEISF